MVVSSGEKRTESDILQNMLILWTILQQNKTGKWLPDGSDISPLIETLMIDSNWFICFHYSPNLEKMTLITVAQHETP